MKQLKRTLGAILAAIVSLAIMSFAQASPAQPPGALGSYTDLQVEAGNVISVINREYGQVLFRTTNDVAILDDVAAITQAFTSDNVAQLDTSNGLNVHTTLIKPTDKPAVIASSNRTTRGSYTPEW